jgi:diamine N-acetyltransferase
MKLRRLELKDAELMLEWMHDPSVVENLQTDFASKTIADCEGFIISAQNGSKDLHLSIVDDDDKYRGTVSLKHIQNGSAEFAITVCKSAMGKGYSKYAMTEIIRIGFEELNLQSVYWCVSPENKRAICFYDKNGYQRVDAISLIIGGVYWQPNFVLYMVSENQGVRRNSYSKQLNMNFFPRSGMLKGGKEYVFD